MMILPVLNLILAVFRSPELGFLGEVVPTFRQTPFNSGAFTSRRAGETALRARCCTRHPYFKYQYQFILGQESWRRSSHTLTTWLYVENGVGVAEKFLRREGVGDATFLADMEKGIRTEGIKNL